MADRTIPLATSTRTIPTPDAGGGGGGGGNPWKDWTELSLNPSDWQIQHGTGSAAKSATITESGGVLTWNAETSPSSSIELAINNNNNKGSWLIQKIHLKPWELCGLTPPAGVAAHEFYPEAFSLKIEVRFEDIPITGPVSNTTLNGYGQNIACIAGLVRYGSDQGGTPATPANNTWMGAKVYKFKNVNPATSAHTNLYKAGYMAYNQQFQAQGYKWKCQPSTGAEAHDSIVFDFGGGATGIDYLGRWNMNGGSYSSNNPYATTAKSGASFAFTSTTVGAYGGGANDYVHIMIGFNSIDNAGSRGGSVRINRIRYLLQPLSNRADLTPA